VDGQLRVKRHTGIHALMVVVGACEDEDRGCTDGAECPEGCWSKEMELKVHPLYPLYEIDAEIPPGVLAAIAAAAPEVDPEPQPQPATVQPRPTPGATPKPTPDPVPAEAIENPNADELVTNGDYAKWLKKDDTWDREKAILEGRAGDAFLPMWSKTESGETIYDGAASDPVVGVHWTAANAYCRSRGVRVASLNAYPLEWAKSRTPILELRAGPEGQFHFKMGSLSASMSRAAGAYEVNKQVGFRCSK